MKWILIISFVFFTSCTSIQIYEGGVVENEIKQDPIWTIVNPPDELVFERTRGEGEDKEVVKLIVKKKTTNLNPLPWIGKVISGMFAFVVGKADVTIPVD